METREKKKPNKDLEESSKTGDVVLRREKDGLISITFKAKIFDIAKSKAIIIPKPVMGLYELQKGMFVDLIPSDDGIMIKLRKNPT